ncbi:unnamed protein product (macronuclear) [Paramecium tetraurelia]|uniref:Uncharacterized protein n=1 Tax=Paramecium tetraurelia TaxID=5888 RepID=A0DH12_PARTE|nr:uncharacterized protein GSPATT00002458001 [Paramecium tetraurelia]CAK82329.1 unnamed protein product [Paramecium tetraurelia]|eukprot:XP_001449726.1 hypothetical protein (macronuclear) [Paramecium tetraurelia strain d4-2]
MQQKRINLANHLSGRNIKCYQHNEPLSHLDLSRVCEDMSRLKCKSCKLNKRCVTIHQFNTICEQLNNQDDDNDKRMNDYLKIFQNIEKTLNQMNEKIKSIISRPLEDNKFRTHLKSYNEIIYSFNNQIGFGLQEFEFLTQCISEEVEFEQQKNSLVLKTKGLNDQKQAETNQYLDLVQQLNQMISSFVIQNNMCHTQMLQNNLKNEQIEQVKPTESDQILICNQEGQILRSNSKLSIADIKLNYDQTILAARLCEPCKNILFWKKDNQSNQWVKFHNLECYTKSLVYFTFSELQNFMITSGSDLLNPNRALLKIWILKEHSWIIKQSFQSQIYSGYGSQRISCVAMNSSESEIFFAEGIRIGVIKINHFHLELKYCQEKSSELITTISLSNDDKTLAVGGCDQKVILWNIEDTKLTQIQKLKLYNTPKKILFSVNNEDLIICTKDGLVHCFNKNQKQKEYIENQKIFNNIAKIRTIDFNHDSSVLAIGGETNILQLWKKNPQNQWKCYNEYKQDDFIEAICFSQTPEIAFASNNNEIYIHQIF